MYSHILRGWGVRTPGYGYLGDTVQPQSREGCLSREEAEAAKPEIQEGGVLGHVSWMQSLRQGFLRAASRGKGSHAAGWGGKQLSKAWSQLEPDPSGSSGVSTVPLTWPRLEDTTGPLVPRVGQALAVVTQAGVTVQARAPMKAGWGWSLVKEALGSPEQPTSEAGGARPLGRTGDFPEAQ